MNYVGAMGAIRRISRFLANRTGNFALSMAIAAPALLGVGGLAVDYSLFHAQRSGLQEVADAAALAAVREAGLQGWSQSVAQSVVDEHIASNLSEGGSAAVYDATVKVDERTSTVSVALRQDGYGYFLIGLYLQHPQIEVASTAALAGAERICALALEPAKSAALRIDMNSVMQANGCSVFSNSTNAKGIEVTGGSKLTANSVCTAGGYLGTLASYTPDPITDCPALPDPLASRNPPAFGACDFNNFRVDVSTTIVPGVYCGGLAIVDGVTTAAPGVYVIKDGEFTIQGNASLNGDNVGFYLTGAAAKTRFTSSTTISLSAPKTGPMAGILVFEDRNSSEGRQFEISSRDARRLVGAIYLPKGELLVRGTSNFAGASEWTAIVARTIEINAGPVISLNSDYAASDIPVPDTISGATGHAYLKQ
jgi:hypothetical protein